ncbi:hypothetical protein RK486_03225, partial [Streptococcus pneumoniae]|nr:hypothetical protein [Streptococcus pneumoniae]
MGLFFYTKIGSIISIGDLPTTNIIEPFYEEIVKSPFLLQEFLKRDAQKKRASKEVLQRRLLDG